MYISMTFESLAVKLNPNIMVIPHLKGVLLNSSILGLETTYPGKEQSVSFIECIKNLGIITIKKILQLPTR